MIDALKIKNDRDLLNKEVELVGTVIASFATNMGWWIKVADRRGYTIFVFSPSYNFNVNDTIVVNGIVQRNEMYGVCVHGTRILRRKTVPVPSSAPSTIATQYAQSPMPQAPVQQKVGLMSKVDAKIWILIAVVVSLIAGFFLYPIISGVR